MKYLLPILILISNLVFSQNTAVNKKSASDSLAYIDKLVQLALDYQPENEIYERRISIAQQDVKQSKAAWLRHITASGNLNEFNLERTLTGSAATTGNNFYPRYNFNVSVPLSTFFVTPAEVKKSREEVKVAEASLSAQELKIKTAVLKTYQDYQMNRELYEQQVEATEDALSLNTLTEQRYKRGDVTYEEYIKVVTYYNDEKSKLIIAKNSVQMSKIDLESLIGMKLEDVK